MAGLPGNNAYPKFETDEVPGIYRLVWGLQRTWTPDSAGPGLGEMLPLEERVSNEFRITD